VYTEELTNTRVILDNQYVSCHRRLAFKCPR
jgi:hypothetical protein